MALARRKNPSDLLERQGEGMGPKDRWSIAQTLLAKRSEPASPLCPLLRLIERTAHGREIGVALQPGADELLPLVHPTGFDAESV